MSAHQQSLFILPSQPVQQVFDGCEDCTAAVARATDPQTSHMAAKTVNIGLGQMLVLSIMQKLGEATDEEIFEAATIFKQTISPSGARTRRAELVTAGFIRDSGRTAKTKANRSTIIWELVR